MTAQTMSFRYELACKGFSAEKAHCLVTLQNDLCCFIGLIFALAVKLRFFSIIYAVFLESVIMQKFFWYLT